MRTTLGIKALRKYLNSQIVNAFNDGQECNVEEIDIKNVFEKLEYCLRHIKLKYFYDEGPVFDHLCGDTYSMFLYLISRELHIRGEDLTATKVYLLNKMMFGIDVYFTVIMPEIFYFGHALGSVLGSAKYSDYLVVYQGVSVGSDLGEKGAGGKYPSFGRGTVLLANTTVIGDCVVGDNVTFAALSFVRNTNIEGNKIVVGQWPDNRLLENKFENEKYYFGC